MDHDLERKPSRDHIGTDKHDPKERVGGLQGNTPATPIRTLLYLVSFEPSR
jgi:hypothetical protein